MNDEELDALEDFDRLDMLRNALALVPRKVREAKTLYWFVMRVLRIGSRPAKKICESIGWNPYAPASDGIPARISPRKKTKT